MLTLHPNILEHNGQKAFAVLPYDEFVKVQEILNDYEVLVALRQAKYSEEQAATAWSTDATHILDIS